MTQENFKDLIEAPAIYHFADKHLIKRVITRMVRLTLQYPEFAKEYYGNLPKVVNESKQPKIS